MDLAIDLPKIDKQAAWPGNTPIPITHGLVPESVRRVVEKTAPTGRLYRVLTSSNVEWWLMDRQGELIDIFWQSLNSSMIKISATLGGGDSQGLEDIRFSRWV